MAEAHKARIPIPVGSYGTSKIMAIIPNLRPFVAAPAANAQAFVDTPNFVYSDWLKDSGGINAPV
jgi:hypothetical protein